MTNIILQTIAFMFAAIILFGILSLIIQSIGSCKYEKGCTVRNCKGCRNGSNYEPFDYSDFE